MVRPERDSGAAPVDFIERLSAIVLFSAGSDPGLLDRVLFSLATSSLTAVQVIVAIHGGTVEHVNTATELLRRQPFLGDSAIGLEIGASRIVAGTIVRRVGWHCVIAVAAPGGGAGVSKLLDEGVRQADGRYVSFHTGHDAPYHRALETLVNRAQSSTAAVVVGCCRRVFADRHLPGSPDYVTRKLPLSSMKDGVLTMILGDSTSPLHVCLVDRHKTGAESPFVSFTTAGSSCHTWLIALAARYRIHFSCIPVTELRCWPDSDDLFADIEKDWEENMPSVKTALLLNRLAGPRVAGNPLCRRIMAYLLKPIFSRQRRLRTQIGNAAAGDI